MSRWSDYFNNHAFGTAWTAVKSFATDKELEKDNREEAAIEIARLNKVIAYVDSVLEQIDPELMPSPTLDAMNKQATHCQNELNSFSSNQNISHLTNANNHIDNIIIQVNQTPFALTGHQKDAFSKAASAYSEAIDAYLIKLKNKVDDQCENVKNNVDEISENVSTLATSLKELKTELKTVSQTIREQTAQFNTQFQNSEKSRSDKFDSVIDKLQDEADSTFEELAIKAGKTLEALTKFQDNAEKVLGVVINTAQAGAYSIYANKEKRAANLLRWSAFVLMIIGVAILVVPEVINILSDKKAYVINWQAVIGRVPLSVILFVPAFYLSRESSRHRHNEIINRRRELILTTIDPYLALLPEDKQHKLKEEIARGIFSEGPLSTDKTEPETSNVIAQIANLMKQFKR